MHNVLDKTDKTVEPFGKSAKRDRYKWRPIDPIGEFRLISKHELNIDGRYQRGQVSPQKVLDIASNWDWILFGALSVADRGEEGLWVVNGGQRTRASFYRDDVNLLPCMVFKSAGVKHEAVEFIAGQTQVTNVGAVDRFRAGVTAEDKNYLRAKALIDDLGLNVSKNAHSFADIKFIGSVVKAVSINESAARLALLLAADLVTDTPIHCSVFRGMFEVARRSDEHASVLKSAKNKFLALGQIGVLQKINQKKALTNAGGSVVEARAILDIINKGKRTKIDL